MTSGDTSASVIFVRAECLRAYASFVVCILGLYACVEGSTEESEGSRRSQLVSLVQLCIEIRAVQLEVGEIEVRMR